LILKSDFLDSKACFHIQLVPLQHGFHDWSDDDLRAMMGVVGESVEAVEQSVEVAPETTRVRLADLTRLAEHVGAKKSLM
jgi:hypothetical protein